MQVLDLLCYGGKPRSEYNGKTSRSNANSLGLSGGFRSILTEKLDTLLQRVGLTGQSDQQQHCPLSAESGPIASPDRSTRKKLDVQTFAAYVGREMFLLHGFRLLMAG